MAIGEYRVQHHLGVFAVFSLVVSLAPSISVDAMRDHLPDVVRFLNSGGLGPVPATDYTYHPKANEVLLTLAWALGEEPAARLVNPGFFVLTLLAAFAVGRACGLARADAMLGVIVVATIPFLHWTGSIIKNDLHVAFLQLGSLLAYFRSRREDERRWLLLGVFLLASSMGVKHTAAFVALPIGLLYLSVTWRRPRLLAQLALVSILFGAHWHMLTFARTGNPAHPWEAEGTPSGNGRLWARSRGPLFGKPISNTRGLLTSRAPLSSNLLRPTPWVSSSRCSAPCGCSHGAPSAALSSSASSCAESAISFGGISGGY